MSRHGEKIHKRKDGRWEGRYKVGNDEYGRTIYASVYDKSYAKVKEKLRAAEDSSSTKSFANSNSFSYAVEVWFSFKKLKLKKATIHKYEYLLEKHILPSLGGIEISKLDANTINDFAEKKLKCGSLDGKKGLSKSYVRTMMIIVTSVIDYASHEGWCLPLVSKIYKPAPEKTGLQILDINEQQILEKNLIENMSLTAIGILLTLQTGLRIGEICALSWDDLDFVNNILYVRSTVSRIKSLYGKGTTLVIDTPKTEASFRAIPLNNKLKNILIVIKEQSTSKYVISDTHSFVSPRTFEYRYHKIMKKLDLPNLNYHALRHTFATRCIEYGVDVKSLSEILGHANVSITLNTYVHSSMQLKRIQLDKLPTL